jgi:hypothetical protein
MRSIPTACHAPDRATEDGLRSVTAGGTELATLFRLVPAVISMRSATSAWTPATPRSAGAQVPRNSWSCPRWDFAEGESEAVFSWGTPAQGLFVFTAL